jgi:hypothetical protein
MTTNSFTTTETLVWMIGKAAARAQRTGEPAAVLFVSVSDLHHWPDTEWTTSERLIATSRGTDSAAQLDTWEWAVLCDSLHEAADAEAVARRFVDALERPIEVGFHESTRARVTVGVTPLGLPGAHRHLMG